MFVTRLGQASVMEEQRPLRNAGRMSLNLRLPCCSVSNQQKKECLT